MGFTEADLEKMGLKKNPDGTYQKPSNPQPRILVKTIVHPTNIEFESGKAPKKKEPAQKVYFNHMDIQDVFAQCDRDNAIFIPGNVPSFKNSKQLFKNKKTGKTFVSSSDLCKKYVEQTDIHWRVFKPRFLEMIAGKTKPYKIQFFFIRDRHNSWDYINVAQGPLDLMQQFGWIENDDSKNVIPDFNNGFGYDKKLPGLIIKVL